MWREEAQQPIPLRDAVSVDSDSEVTEAMHYAVAAALYTASCPELRILAWASSWMEDCLARLETCL
jgi:hypothetical protein